MKNKLFAFFITWGFFMLFYIVVMISAFLENNINWIDLIGIPLIAAVYSGTVLALVGIPTSLFSSWITKYLPFRPIWAFLIHSGVGYGAAFLGFAIPGYGLILGTIFWIADEYLKRKDARNKVCSNS